MTPRVPRALALGAVLLAGFAPSALAAPPPAPPAPTITSQPNTPTNQTSATVAFEGDAGVTFECSFDDGSYSACTSPQEFSGLSDGPHALSVKAVRFGIRSAATTAAWTVDTAAPGAPLLLQAPTGTTTATGASIIISGETGTTSECSIDGGAYASCTSPVVLSGLADGPHSIAVKSIDGAGNVSLPTTKSWTVDTTPPPAPVISGTPSDPTNQTSASLSFTTEPGATYYCSIDGGAWAECTSPVDLSSLADGLHSLEVYGIDPAGNASDSGTTSWTVDTTPPPAPNVTSQPSSTTTSTTASISFTGSGEPGGTFECKIDSGSWAPCSSPIDLNSLSLGGHTVEIRETDAAGNTGPSATVNWTVQSPPVPVCTPRPTPPTPTGTVKLTRPKGGTWVMAAGAKFNTGGDTRGCAQLLSIQVSDAVSKPSNVQPIETSPSYGKGILAWTGGNVSRNGKQPRWMRVGNKIGRWSNWVQIAR